MFIWKKKSRINDLKCLHQKLEKEGQSKSQSKWKEGNNSNKNGNQRNGKQTNKKENTIKRLDENL